MNRTPKIPDGGITLTAAHEQFWKYRNATFLNTPLPQRTADQKAWHEEAHKLQTETLADFLIALASGLVPVRYIDAGERFVIPPDTFAKHRPFAGVISSITAPDLRGVINEPPGDPLSQFNGCLPWVWKDEFDAWLLPPPVPAKIKRGVKRRPGRPHGTAQFHDEHLVDQIEDLVRAGSTLNRAALSVADKAERRDKGVKVESIQKRLVRKFNQRRENAPLN